MSPIPLFAVHWSKMKPRALAISLLKANVSLVLCFITKIWYRIAPVDVPGGTLSSAATIDTNNLGLAVLAERNCSSRFETSRRRSLAGKILITSRYFIRWFQEA